MSPKILASIQPFFLLQSTDSSSHADRSTDTASRRTKRVRKSAVSPDELDARSKVFTLGAVCAWIEKYGGIEGRLRWFETYAAYSRFYQLVAKPLLSLRATGSIDTERSVKPLKHSILTKTRNRLSNQKALTLFRASQNLKYLRNAKKEMKKLSTPAAAFARLQIVQRDPLHCVDLLTKDSS